ncbi:hypothetical protein [Streptantibioticus silvisoli]|uniref:Uncharacterized protein n=1 Tax=Streptantibioticus silvisoli TaxID=2705255 RepID=A0ABT6W8J9_9ACTN|nr:hypothetical protein [Streptantibioticus silvisoli]MDI5965811.1 hypothetical protein [Streptantibioticus silvisoli]
MNVSLCKHSHPCQPPLGSITRPGPCVDCGTSWGAVQDELARQQQALILGTVRTGECPDCAQVKKLFRFQAEEQPWHEFGVQLPITFLCIDCWNTAAASENAFTAALFESV